MERLRILYVHGIRSKPPADEYQAEWDAALRRGGYVPDIDTRLLYWADIRLGLTPEVLRRARRRAATLKVRPFARVRPQTNSLLGKVISLALHFFDPVIRRITHDLWEDVYLYFYGTTDSQHIRDAILYRMGEAFASFRPHLVIAHSWGSVIAYDYLANCGYDGELEGLISLGSPLGNDWVQEHLGIIAYPPQVRRWLNVFDAMDPATWPDRRISNDLHGPDGEHLVRDVEIPSVYDAEGKRNAHSWYGYLISEPVQNEIFRVGVSAQVWDDDVGAHPTEPSVAATDEVPDLRRE
jgi:hypothetical protein